MFCCLFFCIHSFQVSVFDSVVQGGDSVWEGLRIYKGKVFKLEEHLDRSVTLMHIFHFFGWFDYLQVISAHQIINCRIVWLEFLQIIDIHLNCRKTGWNCQQIKFCIWDINVIQVYYVLLKKIQIFFFFCLFIGLCFRLKEYIFWVAQCSSDLVIKFVN